MFASAHPDLPPVDGGLFWQDYLIERGDPMNRGLAALFVVKSDGSLQLIGTAFIVGAEGHKASALTAAHCFEGIRRVLDPHPPHHHTALPEFLPLPKDVPLERVKALHFNGTGFSVCQVLEAYWDNKTDFAALSIAAPPDEPELFHASFWVNNAAPEIGEDIVAVGYGEMEVSPHPEQPNRGTMSFRLVARCGKVEAVHLDGHYMLKGPHIQTSVSVFSGMSGGIVARLKGSGTRIEPFALISHAPDPQPTNNEISGQSVAALLKAELTQQVPERQIVKVEVTDVRIGRR